jgi:hypothetical protein
MPLTGEGDMSEDGVTHERGRLAAAMARRRSDSVGHAARGGRRRARETSEGQVERVVGDLDVI